MVLSEQKVSATSGLFGGLLNVGDRFGSALTSLGDHDGDGIVDVAVGSEGDDDEGLDRGAVWILFLDTDGTVKSEQKISDTAGNFKGPPFSTALDDQDGFGSSVASLGDLDGDEIGDLAVGALGDDDGGAGKGALYVLFLDDDGTVKSNQKISSSKGGFSGSLTTFGAFGSSLASLGDLDGDGIGDLAVGAPGHDTNRGGVWVLFLDTDGTVKSDQEIGDGVGGLGALIPGERFGASIAALGDLDGDEVGDLAVGSDGGTGGVTILFLNTDGTVKSQEWIGSGLGNFTGILDPMDRFGSSVAALGDVGGDAIVDVAVGAVGDDDGGSDRGAVWVLFLDTDGTVQSHQKISASSGGLTGVLDQDDEFGRSVCSLGDLDNDGLTDAAVGAPGDDDGGAAKGAVWGLFLDGTPTAAQATSRNGTAINAVCYTSVTLPILGTTWQTQVDHSGHPGATLTVLAIRAQPSTGPVIPAGEVLINLASTFLFQHSLAASGAANVHSIPIPNDPSFAGFKGFCQALIFGGSPELCNALDLVIGF